jgi:integrase
MAKRPSRREPTRSRARRAVPEPPSCGFSFCAHPLAGELPAAAFARGRSVMSGQGSGQQLIVRPSGVTLDAATQGGPPTVDPSMLKGIRYYGLISSEEVPEPAAYRQRSGDWVRTLILLGGGAVPDGGDPKYLQYLIRRGVPLPVCLPQKSPWTVAELETQLASARATPGMVGDVQAGRWFPALILVLLNTGLFVKEILAIPREGFDHSKGTLTVGPFVHELHPVTIAALLAMPKTSPSLFRWHRDRSLLWNAYRDILYRANLSFVKKNLFDRLRMPAAAAWRILDLVNPAAPIPTRPDRLRITKARDLRARSRPKKTSRKGLRSKLAHVHLIRMPPERTLLTFLEEMYAPRKMVGAKAESVANYRTAITAFSNSLGCAATFTNLNDDAVERFIVWRSNTGVSHSTVNGDIACLCALWRYAWKKHKVEDLPRDVDKLRVAKRLPEAWSTQQLAAILRQCARQQGTIGIAPASQFWLCLCLVLYETGLRVGALLAQPLSAFDPQTGWLIIRAENQKQLADQLFRLHPDTVPMLSSLPRSNEMLFPVPWKTAVVILRNKLRDILGEAGLPQGARDLFHRIRRTNATYVCNAGGEEKASRQMGHSSVALTRNNYIDPRLLTNQFVASSEIPRPAYGQAAPSRPVDGVAAGHAVPVRIIEVESTPVPISTDEKHKPRSRTLPGRAADSRGFRKPN